MRTITLADGKKINIRATNLALLFYKQEFGNSLLVDFQKMIDQGEENIDEVFLMQAIWAMHKASKKGKLEDFINFIDSVEFNYSDLDMWESVIDELMCFFPELTDEYEKRKANAKKKQKNK